MDCADFLQLLSTGDESSQFLYDPTNDARKRRLWRQQQQQQQQPSQDVESSPIGGGINNDYEDYVGDGELLSMISPTIADLADLFRESRFSSRIEARLKSPHEYLWKKNDNVFSSHSSQVSMVSASRHVKQKYANNFFRSTMLILRRFLTIWTRDRRVIIAAAFKNIIMGLSVGGVFFSTTDTVSIEGGKWRYKL